MWTKPVDSLPEDDDQVVIIVDGNAFHATFHSEYNPYNHNEPETYFRIWVSGTDAAHYIDFEPSTVSNWAYLPKSTKNK